MWTRWARVTNAQLRDDGYVSNEDDDLAPS